MTRRDQLIEAIIVLVVGGATLLVLVLVFGASTLVGLAGAGFAVALATPLLARRRR